MIKKRLTRNAKKAFTLIELIIVVAIIGILAALLIPNLAPMVQSSQNQAYVSYRNAVLADYAAATVADENYTLGAYLEDEGINCPYGGQYEAAQGAGKTDTILCSLHDDAENVDTNPGAGYGNNVYDQTQALIDEFLKMTPEERIAAGYPAYTANGTNVRQEEIRNQLKKLYGDTYPQIPQTLLDRYGINGPMYVQPTILYKQGSDLGKGYDVVIFAKNNTSSGWSTTLIFDHEEGVWYRNPKGISVVSGGQFGTWDAVKKEIHTNPPWTPLS